MYKHMGHCDCSNRVLLGIQKLGYHGCESVMFSQQATLQLDVLWETPVIFDHVSSQGRTEGGFQGFQEIWILHTT